MALHYKSAALDDYYWGVRPGGFAAAAAAGWGAAAAAADTAGQLRATRPDTQLIHTALWRV